MRIVGWRAGGPDVMPGFPPSQLFGPDGEGCPVVELLLPKAFLLQALALCVQKIALTATLFILLPKIICSANVFPVHLLLVETALLLITTPSVFNIVSRRRAVGILIVHSVASLLPCPIRRFAFLTQALLIPLVLATGVITPALVVLLLAEGVAALLIERGIRRVVLI